MIINHLLLVLMALTLISCATLNKQIKVGQDVVDISNKEIEHTFYLIGDAGNASMNSSTQALKMLEEALKKDSKNTTVLFLGDNLYPNGLPKKESPKRELAEHRLQVQINSVKNSKGNTIFISGNHDWYSNGIKGVKRQQEFIEEQLGENSFLPRNGKPIEIVEIEDDIVLIIVDSQWYITNWDKQPTINDDSKIKSRNQFLDEFRQEIKKARGKTTIVAIHHPMFSNGPHGGSYDVKSHLKPIPVLGSAKNLIRKTSGIVNADMQNKFYSELQQNLVAAAKQNDKVIFVSGHEHSLQYLEEDNMPQIISGSGSKTTATKINKGGKFTHGANGYAVLDVYKDGSSSVKFISSKNGEIEYQTEVLKEDDETVEYTFQKIESDSVKASVYTANETQKSKFYKLLWGDRFRETYSKFVNVKTVNLDTLFGGVSPVRKGGGTQSKSLRLITTGGKEYVMRALRKESAQFIQAAFFKDQYVQEQFVNSKSAGLISDVFAGSHPYVPLAIGTLSNAIGVYHANPQLLYVPKQEALGSFNNDFGNELYFIEEHGSDGHFNLAGENFTGKIISTYDLFEEINADEDIIVDEAAYIKARLFDMLIGDWDRHQDQWRWLQFKENGKTVYRPLPRDRDQAFSKMSDGFLFGAAVKLAPFAKKFRKYEDDLKDVKGKNTDVYPLDMALITSSDKANWDKQVKIITEGITDQVIEDAFSKLPKEVQDQDILDIKEKLKSRRSNLQKISDRYFKVINKIAVVKGTDKDDYFKIDYQKDGSVEISGFRKKDGTYKDRFHYKGYNPEITKEIWVYALDDEDTFEVFGKSSKIKIRLIGGQNNDDYTVKDSGKNIVIYDYKTKKNDISKAGNATVRLTDKYNINTYDYKKLKNNTNQIAPILGFNPDDGFKIGVSDTYTTYGFKRNPFTSQHKVKAAYFFATKGYEVDYKGEFANVIGDFNLVLDSKFQSSNFSLNFFGYGNETVNNDDDFGLNYNRVKVRGFSIAPSLIWKAYGGAEVSFGASYESIEVHNTQNRFVDNNPVLPEYIFDENQFAGINTKFHFENYDNKAYPTLGIATSIELGYKSNLDETNRNYAYLIPKLALVHKLDVSGNLVLATKLKSHLNLNNNFEFYQAASIGGFDGLRGYRNQRFTGKQSFYQNTDLRYRFNDIKSKLFPIKIGVFGAFDYGRVWLDQESSNKWHNSYGGGVFVNGVNALTVNLGIYNSNDGTRAVINLGFEF
ncbi:MAG: metallophosphoesterase [Flavobacteriaceae bacterium]|nr:metallophosphoesterase [Flavobacteriaceae bacterium]